MTATTWPKQIAGMEFKSIESELWREYTFPGGEVIRITHPIGLNVSASGGHRIYDNDHSHYIPPGWIKLTWKVRGDGPPFVL
jgi:hypothetical protein